MGREGEHLFLSNMAAIVTLLFVLWCMWMVGRSPKKDTEPHVPGEWCSISCNGNHQWKKL